MASSVVFVVLIISVYIRVVSSRQYHHHPSFNIVHFGAIPDGKTDSRQSLLHAWQRVCDSKVPAVMVIPRGTFYTSSVGFEGPCSSRRVTVVIHGVVVGPANYKKFAKQGMWFSFSDIDGLTIKGTGHLDARGQSLWECKDRKGSNCPLGARLLALENVNNVLVKRLRFWNSQMFHISVNGCNNVNILGVKIKASGTSDNTDGIHIEKSTRVNIINAQIQVGDDCISAGEGTHNLWMEDIRCGPGHGISIGSLGKYQDEEEVSNITARNVKFYGTQNGFRIKSWSERYKGMVKHVLFEDSIMYNVANPIIIDQNYCPDGACTPKKPGSFIKISDVEYKNIHGTSASEVAILFNCSPIYPCTGLELQDVILESQKTPLQSKCVHAHGKAIGE
ncbi:Polygalacturonase-like protein, partial [Drosera capensis]